MKRKFLVIPLLLLLILGIMYFLINLLPKLNMLGIEKAESLLDKCQIDSVGQSHQGITESYFDIGVKTEEEKIDYKVNSKYIDEFYKKIDDIDKSGKCPHILIWME